MVSTKSDDIKISPRRAPAEKKKPKNAQWFVAVRLEGTYSAPTIFAFDKIAEANAFMAEIRAMGAEAIIGREAAL